MMPKVSIMIPFYNDPYVDQAINSALNQSYENVEVVVVDDGSTVHQERIAPFTDRIYYLGKANGGTASALNHALRMCTGDYIAWLSSDDLFHPGKIARQVEFMIQHQSAISFTSFDQIDEAGQVVSQGIAGRFPSMREFIRSFQSYCPINGCTVMLRRDLVARTGLFDERLRYTQDYDYWIRVLLGGTTIHFLDEPLTLYRWHSQMGTLQHQPHIQREVRRVQKRYRRRLGRLVRATRY